MTRLLKKISLLIAKQYTSIGGQAVIEGVMMRSPNAFVIAVRKPDGKILLRRDHWFGLSKKFDVLKKPLFRCVLVLIETMANGIVSLNYSANVAAEAESGKKKESEKVDWQTWLTLATSFVMGIALFVLLPHGLTALIGNVLAIDWNLESLSFHLVDGIIKACIFVLYVFLIGLLPDVRRVFQYHGAEHKSIATFEAQEELLVANAKKYSTLHPRCGTTFVFFLIFISILIFSFLFTLIPLNSYWKGMTLFGNEQIFGFSFESLFQHTTALVGKVLLMFPIAGISYELIKLAGKYPEKAICKTIGFPGLMLQKLTTREPDEEQLEVALASIRAVLDLEESYELKDAKEKVISKEELEIDSLADIKTTQSSVKDFLEL